MNFKNITIFLTTLISASAYSITLKDERLYYRCYGHFTKMRPSADDSRLKKIKAKQMSYIDACMEVYDMAKLNQNGSLVEKNNISISVLETFNMLHMSWFQDINVYNVSTGGVNMDYFLHDGAESALHFTRTLFYPDAKFKDSITSDTTYLAERSKGFNTGAYFPVTNNSPVYGSSKNTTFIGINNLPDYETNNALTVGKLLDPENKKNGLHLQVGKLIGITPMEHVYANDSYHCFYNTNTKVISCPQEWPRYTVDRPANLTQSFGSGLIGTQPYIKINRNRNFQTDDGGIMAGRVWSKRLYQDLMCRDLPVVQQQDAVSSVDKDGNNYLPFRNTSKCMQCHVSIDTMAYSIRGLKLNKLGHNPIEQATVFYFLEQYEQNYLAEEAGPVLGLGAGKAADSAFYKRPPRGALYFRSHDGKLIHERIQGLKGQTSLGEAIAKTDDFYLCASKRYFEFLTGHKINIQDITDPSSIKYNAKEEKIYKYLLSLTTKLKSNQNVREIIKEIISSDVYKEADFDIKY